MSVKTTSPIQLLGQIFVGPEQAVEQIEREPGRSALLPLTLSIVVPSLVLVAYYRSIDIDWLVASVADKSPVSQRDVLHKVLTRNFLTGMGVGGVLVTVLVVNAIYALYFYLIAKVRDLPQNYGKWFSLVTWSSVPAILTLPIALISLSMTKSHQLMPQDLNAVSFNQMIFHLSAESPWRNYAESLSPLTIWTTALLAIGYKVWGRTSLRVAALVTLLPIGAVYATWALIIAFAGAA